MFAYEGDAIATIPDNPHAVDEPMPFGWWMVVLPLVFLVVRSVFAPLIELFPDEAYYWDWSRTLQLGYFDHPPMVAWLIRASTELFGTHEFAVRIPALLMGSGSILLASEVARRLGAGRATLLMLQVLLCAFPMLHVQALVITPDVPAMFFVLAMLLAAVHCRKERASLLSWLALGVFAGVAMLSKYTALVPAGAVLTYLILDRPRQWGRVIFAGIIASVVVSPMLAWNAANDWASIRFQFAHGTTPDGRGPLINLADYLGAQLLVATPLLAPLMLYAAFRTWRAMPHLRVVIVPAAATLAFFAITAFRHKVEANWPSQAWLPLAVVLCVSLPVLGERASRLTRVGIGIAAVMSFVLMLPPALLSQLNPHAPHAAAGGWGNLVLKIHAQADGRPIICTRYQDAARFAFYLPSRPQVPLLRTRPRLTHYDFLPAPAISGEFLLVHDRPLAVGPMSLWHGAQQFDVVVLSAGHTGEGLDGIQYRARFHAICRPAGGDVRDQPR